MISTVPAPPRDDYDAFTTELADDLAWRPIHYLGSKLRALPALDEAIASLASSGAPVCDLFAGSGTVSAWLARSRPVTAVDIQEYSRVICDAVLSPARLPMAAVREDLSCRLERAEQGGILFAARPLIKAEVDVVAQARDGRPEGLASLIEAGSLMTSRAEPGNALTTALEKSQARLSALSPPSAGSVVLRHFGGTYFSYRQAAELDVLLDYAHSTPVAYRSTLIAAVLSTASELVNTVGKHFAQPLRPRNKDGTIKGSLYTQTSRDRHKSAIDVFDRMLTKYIGLPTPRHAHRTFRSDYFDFLGSPDFDAAVVYADPPYTRDHYSRFYHVLETMALRDDPQISTNAAHGRTVPSRGVYRQDRHQSPFCIRSEAPAAFRSVVCDDRQKRHPVGAVLLTLRIGAERPPPRNDDGRGRRAGAGALPGRRCHFDRHVLPQPAQP